jgi:hypothetical protein
MKSSADPFDYEEVAAEWLMNAGEVALGDRCDELDAVSDAALADQMVTAWAERIGKPDFGRLVEAFGRLRSEDGATRRSEPR